MPTPPYDLLNTVINAARVRLNDAVETLQPVGGKILKNTQPFSQQIVNNAWRKMQEFLADLGYTGLKQEIVFAAVPAAATNDPITQVYINYANYFDGVSLQGAPVLPQTMITPYDLWERPSGTTQSLTEMDRVLNGLPATPKMNWNRQFEWRDDTLYMPGALVPTDIRLRFAAYMADFADAGGTPWYSQPVPIMRSLDSFAGYMCREISIARGDMDAAVAFQVAAEADARLILNRDTAQPKAILKASEFGKMQDRFTPNTGADTQPIKR